MTTTKNAENLQQYKSTFSLIVEQIWALNWLEKLRIFLQITSEFHNDFFGIDNSHSDR